MSWPGLGTAASLRARQIGVEDSTAPLDLSPAPVVSLGFCELRSYAIAQPGSGFTFHVDDEPLAPVPGEPKAWLWKPGFFAGEVTAELRQHDGTVAAVYRLDVSPDPAKTGRQIFQQMIQEIWDEDPGLVVGSEPSTVQIGEIGQREDPLLALARLRQYGPDFVRALQAVQARPRRTLVMQRETLPMHRVRRVDRQTAIAALRSPDTSAYLSGATGSAAQRLEPRLDVPCVEETLDSGANRCLLALAQGVQRRTRTLFTRLQEQVDRERSCDTRTPLATRWPARKRFLEELDRALESLIRQPPFAAARRAEITSAGLNAISADPLYARSWSRGWRAVRRGISGPLTEERLWISPTWEIYERWCFVRLADRLREACPGLSWTRGVAHPTGAQAIWRGQGPGTKVELLLQPKLPGEHPNSKHGFWAISSARIPDLLIAIEDRRGRRFFVLDAKYRRTRAAVVDAMTSAHIYQDSLRLGDRRAEGTLLLIPAGGEAAWLEDPTFHERHRVGVYALSPEGDIGLPEMLRRELESLG